MRLTQMKCWIIFWMILAAITSSAVADKTLKDVEPGSMSVDLGDGYKISFMLDDSFEMYDLDIIDPSTSVVGKRYCLDVYEAGESDILVEVWVYVWPWEELYPKYEASEETSYGIVMQTIPQTIDDSYGAIYHSWLEENASGDSENANQAEFVFLPGGVLSSDGRDVKSTVEVHGQIDDWDSDIVDLLPVFESIVDSIHVSGPAI